MTQFAKKGVGVFLGGVFGSRGFEKNKVREMSVDLQLFSGKRTSFPS